jgi:dTDP-4-amino-4,6-dideoxygalactose transaminase
MRYVRSGMEQSSRFLCESEKPVIPVLDLVQQYHSLKADIDAAIAGVLESGVFIMGPNVHLFEREIADYLGARHAISLNSGTDALHLALRALDVGPGDEVITSPFTFVATSEAIGIVGATPVFADIDPVSFNIDAALIEAAITPRTKVILPIHLYGAPANMSDIISIARRHNLAVVEDCAQAIGAQAGGAKVGTIGDVGCFSFFPSKNLGAYGDGGLISTNDAKLAERIESLRVHGARKKYYHDELGVNSRLDEIQASILRVKLRHLDTWIQARRQIARRYDGAFADAEGIGVPAQPPGGSHVFHQYTVRVSERDEVRRKLADSGVQSMVYYPIPLHLQALHKDHFQGMSFPHAERAAREVLSLPMYPELASSVQDRVITALKRALNVESAA